MCHQAPSFFFGLSFRRYGDKVPKANVSKAFAIVWILTGLVMMSILSGALTTAITIFVFEADIILYGTKVGLGHHMRSKTLICQQLGTRALYQRLSVTRALQRFFFHFENYVLVDVNQMYP